MKELTSEERIRIMSATAESFSKILSFAHENGWEKRFYFNLQYLFHGYEDKAWFTIFGVVDGDETAVPLNTPDLYTQFRDADEPYLRPCALTYENALAAADLCIDAMQYFIDHYNEFAAEYRAEKEGQE